VVIGLDTSVLIRLLIGLPAEQASTAVDFIKRARIAGRETVVSDLVISEAYFALHSHYKVPKPEAIAALRGVLRSGLVEPADGPEVVEMLEETTRSSSKPGFVDRLIHAQYERLSASMVTFEHAAGRLAGTTVIP
jgi:predicted nucleic acid-binding protein